MLRPETKVRARALQLLYACELQGRPPVVDVANGLRRFARRSLAQEEGAEMLAREVLQDAEHLDDEIQLVAEGWPLSRMGAVELNILRLSLHELLAGGAPPKVVIDEGVRLAHWFAGEKGPAFVNGVLDALARRHGRL